MYLVLTKILNEINYHTILQILDLIYQERERVRKQIEQGKESSSTEKKMDVSASLRGYQLYQSPVEPAKNDCIAKVIVKI